MESIIFPNPQLFLKTDFPAGYIILHIYIYTHIPLKDEFFPPEFAKNHLSWGFQFPPTPFPAGKTQEKCTCTLSPTDSVPSAEDKYRAEVARHPGVVDANGGGFGKDGNQNPPNAPKNSRFFWNFYLVLVICPDIYR